MASKAAPAEAELIDLSVSLQSWPEEKGFENNSSALTEEFFDARASVRDSTREPPERYVKSESARVTAPRRGTRPGSLRAATGFRPQERPRGGGPQS